MRLARVRTGTGEWVSLEFGPGGVEVRAISAVRQRAARVCGGSLVVAFSLAAVAMNADNRGVPVLGPTMWIAAVVVLVAGGLGAGCWWLASVLRQRGEDRDVITADTVTAARSSVADGEVTVSISTADGAERSFSVAGHAGAVLATEFGRLLQPNGIAVATGP
ncbi:hypothetical protein [Actinoplanes sp. NPDC051494]|uniref:hypothetical protein n=1 Tax=Actinoplanes sp. NPDC051494 TaxID=3363907 RepID=UPI00379527D7